MATIQVYRGAVAWVIVLGKSVGNGRAQLPTFNPENVFCSWLQTFKNNIWEFGWDFSLSAQNITINGSHGLISVYVLWFDYFKGKYEA